MLVAGHVPQRRQTRFLQQITLVMGQKQQLLWDLPPVDTFALNRAVYDVPAAQFDETLAELVQLLEIEGVMRTPTRQLSLGERMKCELCAALLHRPKVLFLDEPTIGLHPRDTQKLLGNLRALVATGSTVLVVEHDEETIRAADHLIDLGPSGGRGGGVIVAAGPAASPPWSPTSWACRPTVAAAATAPAAAVAPRGACASTPARAARR